MANEWTPGSGLTTKERVTIEIDPETNDYAVEFFGGNFNRILGVLLEITERMQDGSLFREEGINIYPSTDE